jgi:fermentation-respiration switch protein FrsA (DUF1100 family)
MPLVSSSKPLRFSRQYWRRLGVFTGAMLAITGLSLLAYFLNIQIKILVFPQRNQAIGSPLEVGPVYQDVTLTAADGLKIAGWYFPGVKPAGIVLVHGIHANRAALMPEAKILAQAGYHLLMIDLRGHGYSGDDYLTYGYREAWDVQAAVDYLAAAPGVKQVGVLGISMGGAAAVRAAGLEPRIKAVVVESSYSSLPAAVEDAFDKFSVFPKRPFAPLVINIVERIVGVNINQVDSARDLATLSPRAVLIIHGANDGLFPVSHALKMYTSAREPKELWIIEGLDHGNPAVVMEDEYRRRVVTFFERAFNQ